MSGWVYCLNNRVRFGRLVGFLSAWVSCININRSSAGESAGKSGDIISLTQGDVGPGTLAPGSKQNLEIGSGIIYTVDEPAHAGDPHQEAPPHHCPYTRTQDPVYHRLWASFNQLQSHPACFPGTALRSQHCRIHPPASPGNSCGGKW